MPPTIASPRAVWADLAISWRNEMDKTQVEPLAGYLRSRGGVSSVAIGDDIKQGREIDHWLGVVPTIRRPSANGLILTQSRTSSCEHREFSGDGNQGIDGTVPRQRGKLVFCRAGELIAAEVHMDEGPEDDRLSGRR